MPTSPSKKKKSVTWGNNQVVFFTPVNGTSFRPIVRSPSRGKPRVPKNQAYINSELNNALRRAGVMAVGVTRNNNMGNFVPKGAIHRYYWK